MGEITKAEQAEHREMLAKALESGEFTQTYGFLKRIQERIQGGIPAGMCCLGVGCEIYRRETGDGVWTDNASTGFFNIGGGCNDTSMPAKVAEWFGFPLGPIDTCGSYGPFDGGSLAGKNDNLTPFSTIAELVRTKFNY